MSTPLATYSFLPWLRQGIANNISQPDGDVSVKLRASIPIELTVSGIDPSGVAIAPQKVSQQIDLYGPGDIIGLDSKAIVKNEPRNWITNFEPNYLPYLDFYEEDLPWRYTPATPTGERLRPWLTLVVLKEDEFEDGKHSINIPLPFFKLKEGVSTAKVFPKPSELWAWAHVHVNEDLSDGAEPNTANASEVNNNITSIINNNPDYAYSRLLSSRKLEENVGYYAFVIPTFESGRLAGLGRIVDENLTATACGWDDVSHIEFPYYHRWFFRTGKVGDFEYLVNLLKPKLADKSVGVRDIDVMHPGSNLPPISNPELEGVLKLGGALRVPFDTMNEDDKAEVIKYDEWDENPYPHEFTSAMASRINLAEEYKKGNKTIPQINKEAGITLETDDGDPDPVVTSPMYGRWYALQKRLLKDEDNNDLPHNKNWVHELNLDPRFRIAAGIGTQVVQKNQEEYMHSAWEQIGKIVEANNKILIAQLAKEVSFKMYDQKLLPLLQNKTFTFTAPIHARVMHNNFTVLGNVMQSTIPHAMTTGVFRSAVRPRAKFMKKLPFTEEINSDNLLERVNNKEVHVAPPKEDSEGAINLKDFDAEVAPKEVPPLISNLIDKYKWFKYLPLILMVIAIIVYLIVVAVSDKDFSWTVLGSIVAVFGILFLLFVKWDKEIEETESFDQDEQTPESVERYPKITNFKITYPGTEIKLTKGATDSIEAQKFKLALKDVFTLVSTKYEAPKRESLNIAAINTKILKTINPTLSFPKQVFSVIKIPPHLQLNLVETFAPVMAYPEIDIPMYKPLAELSSELFLPNINKIEQNSITLLENNQKFIEAYMVGINHEMSRELLWREFLTDQRGSYFRQFWDVNSFLPPQPVPEDIKEQLRDIPPIHRWSKINSARLNPSDPNSVKRNELGSHNQRALASGKTQLVLVIRGELLKKYPTAVVYAQKAVWGEKNGVQDVTAERALIEFTEQEKENPPLSKLKTPLFEAKVEPDIYFFGFDLDDEEARGTADPSSISDDPGWFFVIKERPGEPRFGLDIDKADDIINWNNLSWEDVGTENGNCIELNKTINFDTYNSVIHQENKPVEDDVQAKWSPSTNSAELAYILYQVPVMVAVHASRMLPKKTS